MAIVTYGPLVEGISGKVGGSVFMRSPGQNVVRGISSQTKVSTNRRQQARATMAAMVGQWRMLGDEKRMGWSTLAKTGAWDRTSKSGGNIPMSGYNLFMMQNLPRPQANLPLITEPPSVIPLPTGMSLKEQFSEEENLRIIVDGPLQTAFEGQDKILIWATAPLSGAVNSIPAKTLRLIFVASKGDFSEHSLSPPEYSINLSGKYLAAFGIKPAIGNVFGIAVQYLKEQFIEDKNEEAESQKKRPVRVVVKD